MNIRKIDTGGESGCANAGARGLLALACATLAACASAPTPSAPPPPTSPALVPQLRPGMPAGYLPRGDLPNSFTLLAPPPAPGSPAAALDESVYRSTRALRDSARWKLAADDAVLAFPMVAQNFSCALGVGISAEATPHLAMLLRRSLVDAGLSTYAAKDHYKRQRPFVQAKEATCTPSDEPQLSRDGSYPSGHSALGWASALILAEIAPERTDALLARGLAYGQSRVVCGVHWQSDVDAGRVVGAGAVARLHSNPVFNAQLALAREEVAAARAKGSRPERDCAAEAAALGGKP